LCFFASFEACYAAKKTCKVYYPAVISEVGNYFIITDEKKYGIAREDGILVLPVKYDKIVYFTENVIAYKDNKAELFTRTGEQRIETAEDYEKYEKLYSRLYKTLKNGK